MHEALVTDDVNAAVASYLQDLADVARVGFDAMMRGDGDVVSGWKNKLQTIVANVTPAGVLAEQHRKQAEPGSAPADPPQAARKAGR